METRLKRAYYILNKISRFWLVNDECINKCIRINLHKFALRKFKLSSLYKTCLFLNNYENNFTEAWFVCCSCCNCGSSKTYEHFGNH